MEENDYLARVEYCRTRAVPSDIKGSVLTTWKKTAKKYRLEPVVKTTGTSYYLIKKIKPKGKGLNKKTEKVVAKKADIEKIVKAVHWRRHYGVQKTKDIANAEYSFDTGTKSKQSVNIQQVATTVVNNCTVCRERKIITYAKPLQPILAKKMRERWQIDVTYLTEFVTERGNQYIITIIDCFSKYMWAFPSVHRDADAIENALRQVFETTQPELLQSDNGGEFVNKKMELLLKEFGVNHVTITPHTPRENGQVEKSNESIKGHLRVVCLKNNDPNLKNWDLHLPEAVIYYNSTYHMSLGGTPYFVENGTEYATTPSNSEDDYELAAAALRKNAETVPLETRENLVRERQAARAEKIKKKSTKGPKPNFQLGQVIKIRTKQQRAQLITKKDITGRSLFPYCGTVAEIAAHGFTAKVKWIDPPPNEEAGAISSSWYGGDLIHLPPSNPHDRPPSPVKLDSVTVPNLSQISPDVNRIAPNLFSSEAEEDEQTDIDSPTPSTPAEESISLEDAVKQLKSDPALLKKFGFVLEKRKQTPVTQSTPKRTKQNEGKQEKAPVGHSTPTRSPRTKQLNEGKQEKDDDEGNHETDIFVAVKTELNPSRVLESIKTSCFPKNGWKNGKWLTFELRSNIDANYAEIRLYGQKLTPSLPSSRKQVLDLLPNNEFGEKIELGYEPQQFKFPSQYAIEIRDKSRK